MSHSNEDLWLAVTLTPLQLAAHLFCRTSKINANALHPHWYLVLENVKAPTSDRCWSYTPIQSHTILFSAWWNIVLSCNKSGSHGSDYTGCCLLGYDGIYKCKSESQKPATSFNLTRKKAKSLLYFYQTKRHYIPQDSHSGILGEDCTKVSQFLSAILTVVCLLSQK
jgi:hypothetical protein